MRRPRADVPGPGQRSVWDFPRPPRVEPSDERVQVWVGGALVADTVRSLMVLETSHAPVYYLPIDDVVEGALSPTPGSTFCEFKGLATYYDLSGGGTRARRAAWTYREPSHGFEALQGTVGVYPQRVGRCEVDGEVVRPVGGDFYAGWITSRVTGPFKGEAGTEWW